jgi:putative component of membrane protein insertase Oxa1/YidC/SpoIIIJ protein YidD
LAFKLDWMLKLEIPLCQNTHLCWKYQIKVIEEHGTQQVYECSELGVRPITTFTMCRISRCTPQKNITMHTTAAYITNVTNPVAKKLAFMTAVSISASVAKVLASLSQCLTEING